MDIKETLVEIIKLTHSTDGGQDSAYERLQDIRKTAGDALHSIDPAAEEEVALD